MTTMAEALPKDIPLDNRTPTIADEQVILSFMEGHDADIPSNAGTVDVRAYQEQQLHAAETHYHADGDIEKGAMQHDTLEKGALISEKSASSQSLPSAASDPNIVDWDGPEDPSNPMNWSQKRKWGLIAVLSAITFVTYANPRF